MITLLWIVIVMLAVRWALRSRWRQAPSGLERARGVLAERYARGEIDAEEYQQRLDRLQ